MGKVYGGLLLKDLVGQNKQYQLQCALLREGLIQGIQLRVDHPSLGPQISPEELPDILKRWPGEIFVHLGAESVGVDCGRRYDENKVFQTHGKGRTWEQWNKETLDWGITVANLTTWQRGVAHPGYGRTRADELARNHMLETLNPFRGHVLLENVPPLAFDDPRSTTNPQYWGFGGTPDDMARILSDLKAPWECLIDFTHLLVLVNQANQFPDCASVAQWENLGKTLQAYFDLPHSPVSHFSGLTDELTDYFCKPLGESRPPTPLKEAMARMEVVCLEIPFSLETSKQMVYAFRELYL